MAIAASLATPEILKSFKRKTYSKTRIENKNWYEAAQAVAIKSGVDAQMGLDQFQKIIDLYPEKRVVIYSSQTHQPSPNGQFTGEQFNFELADTNTLFIFHDVQCNHFSWIQNMQIYTRSVNSHRDHLFCAKCLGWIRKRILKTHRCIYEFRCIDCGNHEINSSGDLMYHRNKNVHGTRICTSCNKDVAGGLCIETHENWCDEKSMEWITCEKCAKKYAANWKHLCHHRWCNKCSKHYPENEDHRCFISKDKYWLDKNEERLKFENLESLDIESDLDSDVQQITSSSFSKYLDIEARPSKKQKTDLGSRHYVYDIESTMESELQSDGTAKDRHTVALIIVLQLYTDYTDISNFMIFRNLEDFFKFALTKKRSYFWAHNAKGYDSQLLFSYITHHSTIYTPKNIIFRGEKLLQFCIKTIKFRDSMCHLASSLDSLPKMLGFEGECEKGFFPHMFNTPENQSYIGPLPDQSYYDPEDMKPERLLEFETWYKQESLKTTTWNFQEELVKYCKLDVLVLAKALEKYDTLMKDLNQGLSPLTNVTLASYALTVFRNLHMPDDCMVVHTEEEYQFAVEALHGGKTDVRILHREWSESQIDNGVYGCYIDVQSMYPYVQYMFKMPCGIPKWRVFDDQVDLSFLKTFIGFAECDIHPTKYLHHPVIGSRDQKSGKYVFDLLPKKRIILTSIEIQSALENGYEVTKIYKALEFPERQVLFRSFIQKFLKIKLEASGIPTQVDWKTFAKNHLEILGIELVQSKMEKNPGLRAMAKLMLNSLWGKLGQNPNLQQTITFNNDVDYKEFVRKEQRGMIDIKQFQPLPGNRTIVQFVKNDELSDLSNKNVAVAAFVAAYGRLYLWETLHKLGDRILYHDTDSIVYEHIPEGPNVTLGYMLGDWENELDENDSIKSFVALGPKTYSYQTVKGKSNIKCKGFSLTSKNREIATHNSMINLIGESKHESSSSLDLTDKVFKWDRKSGEYWTYLQSKLMRFTADKNDIDWDTLTTKPFGHENFN